LAVPQLSAALSVAQPLASGVQELFGAGNGSLHLGLYDSFVGKGGSTANELKACYIAVVRAAQNQVNPKNLWVLGDELHEGTGLDDGQHVPFERFDHMLYRVETREELDDWNQLTSIQDPFQQAVKALGDGEKEKAESLLRTAIVAVLQSSDLTNADRRRLVTVLKEDFDQVKKDLGYDGLVDKEGPILQRMMKRAISVDAALEMGEPTFEEVFG
jgi:hypothetical protein